ncbi:epoxidase subunit a [Lentinula edodes]|uniref:Epoxidase subunit a n=1 Tax=Lentinula edodes TaxID=5353 RepID=A0A1Q3ECS1_LENED|nr:epoxidase subunit a [Lentinula edodes]
MVHITPDRKAAFARDGFLVLPAISKEISHNIEKWANEVKNLPYRPDTWMHYDEVIKSSKSSSTEEKVLCRTENFADYHEGFKELFRGAEMTSILEQLTGEPMVLFKEKINYEQPQAGGYQAHIDSLGYRHIGNVSHLSILMAAEPATLENGCLEVVASSHKMSIPIDKNKCIQQEWCDEQKWIPVPLESGQFLVFGSYLAHRSAPNKSDKGQAAIYATYNAISDGGDRREAYYEDRRKLWPPTAERLPEERYDAGAKIYGFGTPMLSIVEDGYKNSGL